jgi:hypothetical protein
MIRLPADRARDALIAALEPHAAPFAPIAATSREWASGLFFGARHRIALRLLGDDRTGRGRRLETALGEMDLPIARGFVADVQVSARLEGEDSILAIEALTIDDPETVSRVAVRRAG